MIRALSFERALVRCCVPPVLARPPLPLLGLAASRPQLGGCRAVSTATDDALLKAPEKPDYYRLLGVGRNATPDQIKAAFREQGPSFVMNARPYVYMRLRRGAVGAL